MSWGTCPCGRGAVGAGEGWDAPGGYSRLQLPFSPAPTPSPLLPARASQAAAPSLGWHRISICLVKLKVCTAPKSEPGPGRGAVRGREAGAPAATQITPCPSSPQPFLGSPSAAGPGRVRCREAGEKLRVLCVGWPGLPWGWRRRHQAAFGRSSPGRRSGRLRQGPPTSAPSRWVPTGVLHWSPSPSTQTLKTYSTSGGAIPEVPRSPGPGEGKPLPPNTGPSTSVGGAGVRAEGRGPLQLPSGGNNGVWARNPTFMTVR